MIHSICMRPCSFSDFGAVAVNCLLRPYRRSVMYFRFRGWRHVRRQSAGRGDAVVTQSDSPGAAPDRGRSLMFMIASLLQGVTRTIVVSIPVCVCVCVKVCLCARSYLQKYMCAYQRPWLSPPLAGQKNRKCSFRCSFFKHATLWCTLRKWLFIKKRQYM